MSQKHTKRAIATEVGHKVRTLCPKCGKNMTVTQELANDIINAFIVELALAMRDEEVLQMRGLGTFRLVDNPTTKWNPRAQEKQEFPPSKGVRFKVSQSFVDIVTGEDEPYEDLNPDLAMVAPNPDVAANFDAQTKGE